LKWEKRQQLFLHVYYYGFGERQMKSLSLSADKQSKLRNLSIGDAFDTHEE
jgi:hypothetical protein